MRTLDLRQDAIEEYEGRLVEFGGATYRIGPWVGEGAERVVHRLQNVRSGLALHLIKIRRDRDGGLKAAEREAAIVRRLHDSGLPVARESVVVQGYGGVLEIDEVAAPENGELADLEAAANSALEASRFTEAVEKCRQVLAINPNHTQALHMLAYVISLEGHTTQALKLDQEVLEIEPNIRPYWFGQLTRLAAVGLLWSFLTLLSELNARWPHERQMNSLAAGVFLALGRPEDAANLDVSPIRHAGQTEDSAWRDDKELAELVQQIELERNAHSMAGAELRLAREATVAKDDEQAIAALRRAYGHYPKDPRVSLNLAFAMLRGELWSDAYDLLTSMPAVLPPETYVQRLGSMAFASAGSGHTERAASLLEDVAHSLADNADGEAIDYWDLPGWVRWWENGIETSERSDRPAQLLSSVMEQIESPSPALRSIAELYARGPSPAQP